MPHGDGYILHIPPVGKTAEKGGIIKSPYERSIRMKKNKTMRAAGGLLIATMLTSSIVSGTYAKYVTSDSASDTARVAKFGVTVTASGELFDKTYLKGETNTPGGKNAADTDNTALTVESSNENNLVAPGTKNDTGLTFTVTGKPEVDVQLTVDIVGDVEEVFLKQKTGLPDMTTGDETDIFDNNADYYPVKFTLTQTKGGTTTELVKGGKLEAVADELNALDLRCDANTDLATEVGTLNLTWEWAFESGNDQQDTLLGDLAAGTTLVPATTLTDGTDYNLDENISITVTVTQVD